MGPGDVGDGGARPFTVRPGVRLWGLTGGRPCDPVLARKGRASERGWGHGGRNAAISTGLLNSSHGRLSDTAQQFKDKSGANV